MLIRSRPRIFLALLLVVIALAIAAFFVFSDGGREAVDSLGPQYTPLPSRIAKVWLWVSDPAGQLVSRFWILELTPGTFFSEKPAGANPCPVEFNLLGYGFSRPAGAGGRKERRYQVLAYGFVPETVAIEEADTLANPEPRQELTVRLQPCPPEALATFSQLRYSPTPHLLWMSASGDPESGELRRQFEDWRTRSRFPSSELSAAEVREFIVERQALDQPEAAILLCRENEFTIYLGAARRNRTVRGMALAKTAAEFEQRLREAVTP